MKKILLILLCIIMIFCNVVWTSAATNNHCVTEISEYDMYKELISVDDETLKGEGFSEEDIRKLRETDPAMELIELSKKNISELKKMSYDAKEISVIMKAKDMSADEITEDMLRVVGAKVALTFSIASYGTTGTLTKGTTSAIIKATWEWDKVPSWNAKDKLAFSWGKSLASDDSKSYISILHYPDYSPSDIHEIGEIADKAPNQGCSFDINMKSMRNGGYAYVHLYSNQQALSDIECRVAYGHNTGPFSPSVSWHGVTISFSPKSVMTMNSKTLTLR